MRDIISRLNGTIKRAWVLVRIPLLPLCLFAIITGCFFYISTGISGQLKHNNSSVLLLASEMATETGPDFMARRDDYNEFINKTISHMENGQFSSSIRILFPKLSPQKHLTLAIQKLNKAKNQLEAMNAINEALEEIVLYSIEVREFAPGPTFWRRIDTSQEIMLVERNQSIAKSEKMLKRLKEDLTPENAYNLCAQNRKTFFLLFLTRSTIQSGEILALLRCVERSHTWINEAQKKTGNIEIKASLSNYVDSERRRINILQAILQKDEDKIQSLLLDAISNAFKEKVKPKYVTSGTEG